MLIDPIELTKSLISFETITPKDNGISDFLIKLLSKHNFNSRRLIFEDTTNIYAKIGHEQPNLCFVGHTDVVHPGEGWSYNPFKPVVENGFLYGRGAVDMKSSVAAFISAAVEFTKNFQFKGAISIILSGDEEGYAINGMPRIIDYLRENNQVLSECIVGEPTCENKLGDTIKYGRRGSINFELTLQGKQGHVAYPDEADNALTKLIIILDKLKQIKLDEGSKSFSPSNLEITNIEVAQNAQNIIPGVARADFNIRFNDLHNYQDLLEKVRVICSEVHQKFNLEYNCAAKPFLGKNNQKLIEILSSIIKEETGIHPKLSTSGGTSDVRFIKDIAPVIEFGLVNKTAHKIDEHVKIEDINKLTSIYYKFLQKYFGY